MPRAESLVPDDSRKSLNYRASQSAAAFSTERAIFFRRALPKLARAIVKTDERLRALHKGVERVIGSGENERVVVIVPDADIARMNASLCQLIDLERSLLGFPSPGRRRDTSETPKQAPTVYEINHQTTGPYVMSDKPAQSSSDSTPPSPVSPEPPS